eukprot:765525-Hanusia_phi.AAC.5
MPPDKILRQREPAPIFQLCAPLPLILVAPDCCHARPFLQFKIGNNHQTVRDKLIRLAAATVARPGGGPGPSPLMITLSDSSRSRSHWPHRVPRPAAAGQILWRLHTVY